MREVARRARERGVIVVVLLDVGVGLRLRGSRVSMPWDGEPRVEEEILDYARWIVARDACPVERLVNGMTYSWADAPTLSFELRLPSIEERARTLAASLKRPGRTTLRRARANALAAILEALADRSELRRTR
jgi:hypothetical protein